MYRKAWCTCKPVVFLNKPIAVLTVSLPSPPSLLKLPSISVFTAGMPAKLTRVRLRRHAGGKDLRCFLSRRRYVLICLSSIAGSSGGMWEPGLTCFCGLDLNSTFFIFYTLIFYALIFSVTICVQKQRIVHRHAVPNRCFYKKVKYDRPGERSPE